MIKLPYKIETKDELATLAGKGIISFVEKDDQDKTRFTFFTTKDVDDSDNSLFKFFAKNKITGDKNFIYPSLFGGEAYLIALFEDAADYELLNSDKEVSSDCFTQTGTMVISCFNGVQVANNKKALDEVLASIETMGEFNTFSVETVFDNGQPTQIILTA